jgi:hypothetical protein
VVQAVGIPNAPVAALGVALGYEVGGLLKMHHKVATPQDLVPVIMIPGLEPERLIERPRAREIEDWEDRFRTLWSHVCLAGYAHEQLALSNDLTLSCETAATHPSARGIRAASADPSSC